MWKTKFTSLKQFLFGLLFSINTKETDTDQKILQLFNSVKKEISHKPSKAAAAKKFFQVAIVIGTNSFDECFLLHAVTRNYYFLYKLVVTQRVFATVMLMCSLKQVFWKKTVFYLRYLHNNIIMLLMPKV